MAYGDWLRRGERIHVCEPNNPHYGGVGHIVNVTPCGGVVVHLSCDPDYIDRTFSAWDLEDITPGNDDAMPEELSRYVDDLAHATANPMSHREEARG